MSKPNTGRECRFCAVFKTFDNADSRAETESLTADPVAIRHIRLYLTFILRAVVVFVYDAIVAGTPFRICDKCRKRIRREVTGFGLDKDER